MANLDIIVSARGEVISESDLEKIQHREGGILDELLVKEGDYIHKGQAIARLTALERNSELDSMTVEIIRLNLEVEKLDSFIQERWSYFVGQFCGNAKLPLFGLCRLF